MGKNPESVDFGMKTMFCRQVYQRIAKKYDALFLKGLPLV
jgi:hypothetical protein